MPNDTSRKGDRFKASYLAACFDRQRVWTVKALGSEGIARPQELLRSGHVAEYLAQRGWRVWVLDRGARFVGERPRERHLAGRMREALELRRPLLVRGQVGCGKRGLVERLAVQVLGEQGIHCSLGGAGDLDMLVGKYHANGFVQGKAMDAIQQRRPLIIHRLHAASLEVVFLLKIILDRATVLFPHLSDERGEPVRINPWAADRQGRTSCFAILATANARGPCSGSGGPLRAHPLTRRFLDRFSVFDLNASRSAKGPMAS